MSTKDEPTTIWNKYFVQLLILEFALQLGGFTSRPLVANYSISMGASLTMAGFLAGVATTTAMLLRPVSGLMADRVDKKKSLVGAAIAATLAGFGTAWAPSPLWVGAFSAIQGFSLSFKSISVVALIALSVPSNRLGSAIGMSGLITTLTMAIGPAIGSVIGDTWGYYACFLTAGCLCLVGCIIALLYKPRVKTAGAKKDELAESEDGESGAQESFIVRITKQAFFIPAIPYSLVVVFLMWPHSTMSALVLTITNIGYLEAGALYFTAYALLALGARPMAGRLTDEFGPTVVAIPGAALAALGMLLLVFWHSAVAVVIAGACMGIGQASATCAVQTATVRGANPSCLGRATNTYYMGMDIGSAAGPIFGGFLLQVATPQILFGFNMCTFLIALAMLLTLHARNRVQNPHRENDQEKQEWRVALANRFSHPIARIKRRFKR